MDPVDLRERGVSGGGVYGDAVRGGAKMLKSFGRAAMLTTDDEGEGLLSEDDSPGPAERRRRNPPTTLCIG